MRATDTQRFVDNGNGRRSRLCKGKDFPSEQVGETPHCVFAAWRAEIDGRLTFNNGRGVWTATWKATLCTLRLRKKIIHLLHEVAVA